MEVYFFVFGNIVIFTSRTIFTQVEISALRAQQKQFLNVLQKITSKISNFGRSLTKTIRQER